MQNYIKQCKDELNNKKLLYLKIKVIPKTNQTEFRELMSDKTLKISVKAPPTDGKANQVLIKFLKKEFKANEVNLISGQKDRIKLVKILK